MLGGFLAVVAVAGAVPVGAAAEQASQPLVAAAGGLDVGRYHVCALLGTTAGVRCWGYGGDGALGYASTTTIGDDETPAAAGPVDLGGGHTARAIAAGAFHTCGLLDDASVRCWGYGGDGRLGYANTISIGDDEPPGAAGAVNLGGGTAIAITAGEAHTCALMYGGSVRCWGFGDAGRLGYGNTTSIGDDETPGTVAPVDLGGRTAVAISAGDAHTCALMDDGSVRCWGFGGNGRLGYGNTTTIGDDESPGTVAPVDLGGRPAVAISAGDAHTCALMDDGSVRCWGFGGNGRLGYANTTSIGDNETPNAVGPVDLGSRRTAVAISAGAYHTCAVLDNGTVRCWGYGGNGRLGYANTTTIGDNETPGSVGPVDLGAGRTAVAISAGFDTTCARLDNGTVRCWGNGANGILGYCNTTTIGDNETPGSVGPVHLEPGDGGAGCSTAPSPSSPPPSSAPPSSPLLSPGVAPVAPSSPAGFPIGRSDAGLAAQQLRARALRRCFQRASGRARAQRHRARRLAAPARAIARRRIARRLRAGRGHCLGVYGRTPGSVGTLVARATGPHAIGLEFTAVGTDHHDPPAARAYLIKQSLRPIVTQRDFRAAHALCHAKCTFDVSRVGEAITQAVTDLDRGRTYYYAVAARDNVSARLGPRSPTVSARTR